EKMTGCEKLDAGRGARPGSQSLIDSKNIECGDLPYLERSTFMLLRTKWTILLLLAVSVLYDAGLICPAAQGKDISTPTAVFAGGCFWGVDAVFKHVRGVSEVVSGYAGGPADAANYETVSTGTTGHAESVEVTYDP